MNADVTVIVPIYNVEKYVAKCLESLVTQTHSNIEIWAVDDGSPDNSKEIVKEFKKKDPRVKLIEKENGGYGSVLEYCINQIETKYFLICDPDDWLRKDTIEKLFKAANENNLDIVVGERYDVYVEDYHKKNISIKSSISKNIIPKKVYKDKDNIQIFSFLDVSPHAKLYRTANLKGIKIPHKVSYTDYLLYLLALNSAQRVMYYDEPLAYYLSNRPGNSVTNSNLSKIKDYLIVWDATLGQLSNTNNILYYRMYVQLRFILNEYGVLSIKPFKDKYGNSIKKSIRKLRKYKKEIISANVNEKPAYKRLFLHGILSQFYMPFVLLYMHFN